ncbi:hypothetical protein OKW43_001861 [Paraburkholderia sp. WC7.3g]|uniref:hypothetical protein n=1 Tax=Paraburkholderia sp. WC7.3g TaxID=2991070 RepID=UPI003D1B01BA
MSGAKFFKALFCLVVFISGAAFSAEPSFFNGKWEKIEKIGASEKPYSVIDLSLTEDDAGTLKGSYCFATEYGDKIDCSPDGDINITGRVTKNNPKRAIVNFNTFFEARNGVAELVVNDDGSIVWNVVTQPQGGYFFGPNHAVLGKITSEAHSHTGGKLVVTDRAYLYDEPSHLGRHKTYLIKGDYVKLIDVSADLRFWQIEFLKKDGKTIKKWIGCGDIDFCAK